MFIRWLQSCFAKTHLPAFEVQNSVMVFEMDWQLAPKSLMLIFHTKLSVRVGVAVAKRDQFGQAVTKGRDFNTNTEYSILNPESQQFCNLHDDTRCRKHSGEGRRTNAALQLDLIYSLNHRI